MNVVEDVRYDVPLYAVSEAAAHLGMSKSTLGRWASLGLVTSLQPESAHGARLPFIAMAEAQFYLLLRLDGLTFRAIDEGMTAVRSALGPRMLQRDRIAHDGKDVLVNLANAEPEWSRARDGQGGIQGVIERAMHPIRWASDNLPDEVRLVAYEGVEVTVNPRFAFGLPALADSGVRVEDVVGMFKAGDSIGTVADEFGIGFEQVEALVRHLTLAA